MECYFGWWLYGAAVQVLAHMISSGEAMDSSVDSSAQNTRSPPYLLQNIHRRSLPQHGQPMCSQTVARRCTDRRPTFPTAPSVRRPLTRNSPRHPTCSTHRPPQPIDPLHAAAALRRPAATRILCLLLTQPPAHPR
ncbi:hypothetical protein P171DRAFT_201506 [Karstenula rhodostoma CBS 690.94]|uniref:Secreted protein n=1 Tax=Karstenula rhodostoma CBS 690.94 TaxID=1392251 RepID=A0A9P4PVB5_9PLEO|nr:hypothetical protein P171DRAFT_201506 [Karstenula rhodostoma CBS 690.94]